MLRELVTSVTVAYVAVVAGSLSYTVCILYLLYLST